jgi:hypothetical protein
MASLIDEEIARRNEALAAWIAAHASFRMEPTTEEPGSDEKIEVLRRRYAEALKKGVQPSLHHPDDSPGSPDFGYRIKVGKNGRIIEKKRVPLDQANAQEVARAEALSILAEIKQGFANEPSKKRKRKT